MSEVIRVALAEDHELFRQGMAALIGQEEDFEVAFEAGDGQELLTKLKDTEADVLLLDIEMPVFNGIEALSVIRRKFPELGVIMVSMYCSAEFVKKCKKLGAKGFLPKHSDFEEVARAIRSVFNNEMYFDAEILKSIQEMSETVAPSELSEREVEIIELICKGFTNKQIADTLYLSKRTVENHRRRISRKTGTNNTVELVVFAIRQKIIKVGRRKGQ